MQDKEDKQGKQSGRGDEEEGSEDEVFLGAVKNLSSDDGFVFPAHIRELSRNVNFMTYSGADVTCIPFDVVSNSCKSKICKNCKIIYGPDKNRLLLVGYINSNLDGKHKSIEA